MAGIYVHIPFCRKACHYCDFHFSTSTQHMEPMAGAIAKELEMRNGELKGEAIESLYLGGGTPSLMNAAQLGTIRAAVESHYVVVDNAECTVEANPDDLHPAKLESLLSWGANRLSIGIQTFDEQMLQWMNRSHTVSQSTDCIRDARAAGFKNISIDLIYGLPGLDAVAWKAALEQAIMLDVEHVSAYCLTVEPKTVLGHRVKKGTEQPVDEEAAATQFRMMVELLAAAGFAQYEVSNFAKAGFHSRHNSAYWEGKPFMGAGPSAHSLTGGRRSWNVANNAAYLRSIREGLLPLTAEEPGPYDRYNEWIMTGLRMARGIDLSIARERFNVDMEHRFGVYLSGLTANGLAAREASQLKLTTRGLFMADGIAAEMFILEP